MKLYRVTLKALYTEKQQVLDVLAKDFKEAEEEALLWLPEGRGNYYVLTLTVLSRMVVDVTRKGKR